jgi:hypothetical protein
VEDKPSGDVLGSGPVALALGPSRNITGFGSAHQPVACTVDQSDKRLYRWGRRKHY